MAKNPIKTLKWNTKSSQLTQNKEGKQQQGNKQKRKWKTKRKMVDINSTIPIITCKCIVDVN